MWILLSGYFGDLELLVFEWSIAVILFGFYNIHKRNVFRKLSDIVRFQSKLDAVFWAGNDILSTLNLTHHGINACLAVCMSASSEKTWQILIAELVAADMAG